MPAIKTDDFTIITNTVEVGRTYTVEYPFCRDKATIPDDDGYSEIDTWRPGIRQEQKVFSGKSRHITVADAYGEMLLTVVDIHKPGKFPTRVFFTRQWKDPQGKVFGKSNLHIKTSQVFARMLKGYRHQINSIGDNYLPHS